MPTDLVLFAIVIVISAVGVTLNLESKFRLVVHTFCWLVLMFEMGYCQQFSLVNSCNGLQVFLV